MNEKGQQKLRTFLQLQKQPETTTPETTEPAEDGGSVPLTSNSAGTQSGTNRGAVAPWHEFHAEKYLKMHEQLIYRPYDIYCLFCMNMRPKVHSGAAASITKPFSLNSSEKLPRINAHRHKS